ncbi:MAG TPA: HlyD family efflux transporter periplasmic adaptor subunit [Candidatus Binatia bacterium]|nr:HlyD family efflux transporter periplasmic adaptor subunit [Candidatus Binatia bacterium]
MPRRAVAVVIAVAVVLAAALVHRRALRTPPHYTGFVEGEERVVRSEVAGRVVEVAFAEGDAVPAGAVLARLDDADVESQIRAKEQEIRVLEADIATQRERIPLIEATWQRDLGARRADVGQATAAAELAERTFARERDLVKNGASTPQDLDDRRAARDQARSALARARELLARTAAEERNLTVARQELASLEEKRELALRQLEELNVTHAKYVIHAPAVPTVVQTQLIWPGELAQPGTAIAAVIDPKDKYVQIYVPVADRDRLRVGQRVEIELDSEPGRRVPGEVSFVADEANFTPEKIETRSDRLGQVYRAKVRILEGVERFQPGTEGDVYLVAGGGGA